MKRGSSNNMRGGFYLEVEISQKLYELLLMQAAESGLMVEELISFVFGKYIKPESAKLKIDKPLKTAL